MCFDICILDIIIHKLRKRNLEKTEGMNFCDSSKNAKKALGNICIVKQKHLNEQFTLKYYNYAVKFENLDHFVV